MWTLLSFKMHIRKDLRTANFRKCFEPFWVEIESSVMQKTLIKVSYCLGKNLFPYFLDELGGEISQAFASKTEIFIFEDYDIDLLKQDEASNFYDFAANCGLTIQNLT